MEKKKTFHTSTIIYTRWDVQFLLGQWTSDRKSQVLGPLVSAVFFSCVSFSYVRLSVCRSVCRPPTTSEIIRKTHPLPPSDMAALPVQSHHRQMGPSCLSPTVDSWPFHSQNKSWNIQSTTGLRVSSQSFVGLTESMHTDHSPVHLFNMHRHHFQA